MTPKVRSLITYADFVVAAGIGLLSLYLISMPLHPAPGDSHGGVLAVFSGLFLAPIALTAFAAGRFMQQQSKAAWLMQLIALALVSALVLLAIL